MKAIQENKPENANNLENLKKKKISSWGGKRKNSGRLATNKRINAVKMKEKIEAHGLVEETVNGKQQTRVEILLTVLFREGAKGSVSAIKEYLDRQVGKSIESIEVGNKEGRIFNVKITTVGNKKNGNKLETNHKTK